MVALLLVDPTFTRHKITGFRLMGILTNARKPIARIGSQNGDCELHLALIRRPKVSCKMWCRDQKTVSLFLAAMAVFCFFDCMEKTCFNLRCDPCWYSAVGKSRVDLTHACKGQGTWVLERFKMTLKELMWFSDSPLAVFTKH